MRGLLFALVFCTNGIHAQIQNWNPVPDRYGDAVIFKDDLDYYLSSYSEAEIKAMRKQVNIWSMNWDKVMKATIADITRFSEGYGVDVQKLDLELTDVRTGVPYRLSERKDRIRAFMFVSITNPPARFQLPYWDRLRSKYDSAEVDLFVIYGRELHPADQRRFKAYPTPRTEGEKKAYAQELAATLTGLPVLVDGLDGAVQERFGRAPNGTFIFDKQGRLVFRGTWADSRKVEHIIDTLLGLYDAPAESGE